MITLVVILAALFVNGVGSVSLRHEILQGLRKTPSEEEINNVLSLLTFDVDVLYTEAGQLQANELFRKAIGQSEGGIRTRTPMLRRECRNELRSLGRLVRRNLLKLMLPVHSKLMRNIQIQKVSARQREYRIEMMICKLMKLASTDVGIRHLSSLLGSHIPKRWGLLNILTQSEHGSLGGSCTAHDIISPGAEIVQISNRELPPEASYNLIERGFLIPVMNQEDCNDSYECSFSQTLAARCFLDHNILFNVNLINASTEAICKPNGASSAIVVENLNANKLRNLLNQYGGATIGISSAGLRWAMENGVSLTQVFTDWLIPETVPKTLDQFVTLVGYHHDYFILKSNWGPVFGRDGYLFVSATGNPLGIFNKENRAKALKPNSTILGPDAPTHNLVLSLSHTNLTWLKPSP